MVRSENANRKAERLELFQAVNWRELGWGTSCVPRFSENPYVAQVCAASVFVEAIFFKHLFAKK